MVLNADQYRFMCLDKDTENETFIFHNFIFSNSYENNWDYTWDYYWQEANF